MLDFLGNTILVLVGLTFFYYGMENGMERGGKLGILLSGLGGVCGGVCVGTALASTLQYFFNWKGT